MAQWTAAAAARGITLSDTQQQRLDALEKTLTLLSAMIDWKEEPAQVFQASPHPDLPPPVPAGDVK